MGDYYFRRKHTINQVLQLLFLSVVRVHNENQYVDESTVNSALDCNSLINAYTHSEDKDLEVVHASDTSHYKKLLLKENHCKNQCHSDTVPKCDDSIIQEIMRV